MIDLAPRKPATFLFLMALLPCHLAVAQVSPASSGSYARDLGALTAEIRGARWIADICSAAYPDLKVQEQAAVDRWRTRHAPFIAEMDARFDALPASWAATQPAPAGAGPGYWDAFLKKQLDGARDVVRRQFTTLAPEKKRSICLSFPQSLNAARWDLERYHANEVATVRRNRP